jgi:hypothetical protein
LHVRPAAHWLLAVHGAAFMPLAWQLPPWQMLPAAQSKSPAQLAAQTPPAAHK